MAVCIALDTAFPGGDMLVSSTGRTQPVWSAGDATVSDGQYTCPAGSHVLLTPSEASQLTNIPLLQMTPADGAAIASAVLAVWALGWGIRVLIQAVRSSDGVPTYED